MNGVNDDAPRERVGHHGTHSRLLVPPPADIKRHASVDAVVVPTVRPADSLDNAFALAEDLDCPLLVLCSKRASAHQVALRASHRINVIALDIGLPRLPHFETAQLLAGTKLERRTDTSLKRNVGLAIAAMTGWRRVVFLDDDIDVRDPADVRAAAGLLDDFAAVGLKNNGFPDNSVVCHAHRAVGGAQGSFIGGGALAVAASRGSSFFPTIYNEDWFFLLNTDRLEPVTTTGVVTQAAFDPYEDPERARSEELGDCLAEGIFAVLDNGGCIYEADKSYWKKFLDSRRVMITTILSRVPGLGRSSTEKERMTNALNAALGRLSTITPELCVLYLSAWQRDRKHWMDYLGSLPSVGVEDAVRKLGLKPGEPAMRALAGLSRQESEPVVLRNEPAAQILASVS